MPTKTPRVLHVIARFNLGGTAKYLTELIPALEAQNFEVLLAVGRVQKGEVEDSSLQDLKFVRIEKLGRRLRLIDDVIAYFQIRSLVKKWKPDLIQTHTFKAGLLGRLMFRRIPKVHTFHGHLLTDPEFSRNQIKVIVFVDRFLAKFSQKLVTTGRSVAEDLIKHRIGEQGSYISIPGTLSQIDFVPRETARKNLKLGDEFVILWVARVAPVKNAKLLVEVAKSLPDCVFLMGGDGIQMQEIELLAPPNLRILGYIPTSQILLAGDLYLSTSLNEGVPYSILEAKSAGLPVVAVDVGSISEIITDGVDGFLVGANVREIRDRILDVKTSRDSFAARSLIFGEPLVEMHPQNQMVESHSTLYKELLAND